MYNLLLFLLRQSILPLRGRRQCLCCRTGSQQDLSPARQQLEGLFCHNPSQHLSQPWPRQGQDRALTTANPKALELPTAAIFTQPFLPLSSAHCVLANTCRTSACSGCSLDPALPLSVPACPDHPLRDLWDILSHFLFTAGILELLITQLAQVLKHHSDLSQTNQNFPARHLWLCVKFQFPSQQVPVPASQYIHIQSLGSYQLSGCCCSARMAVVSADTSPGLPHTCRKVLLHPTSPEGNLAVGLGWLPIHSHVIGRHEEHCLCFCWPQT